MYEILPNHARLPVPPVPAIDCSRAVTVTERIQTNICHVPYPNYFPTQVVPSPSRGFYVTGVQLHPDRLDLASYVTVRYDTRGRGVWTNVVDAVLSASSPLAIAPDRRGNVVIAGASDQGFDVSKYSANGHRTWSIRHRLPSDAGLKCDLAVDPFGSVVVGYSGRTTTQNEVVRYSASGERLWKNQLEFRFDDIQTDSVGNVYAFGHRVQDFCDDEGPHDQITVKFARTGIPVWTNVIPLAYSARMAVDPSGRVLVACTTPSGANLFKYGRGGSLLWTNRYDQIDSFMALAVDSEGAAYLAGLKYGDPFMPNFSISRVVVKSSPGGRVRWSAEIPPGFLPNWSGPRFGRVNRQFATLVQDIVFGGQYDSATATFRER